MKDIREDSESENKHLMCLISKQGRPPETDDMKWMKDGRPLSNNGGMHLWLQVHIHDYLNNTHIQSNVHAGAFLLVGESLKYSNELQLSSLL